MELLKQIQEIQKYSPKRGDILFISTPSDYTEQDRQTIAKELRKDLNRFGFTSDDCSAYVFQGDIKIELLRKEE